MLDSHSKGRIVPLPAPIMASAQPPLGCLSSKELGVSHLLSPPCPYSEAQLQQAREAGVGGDVLYRRAATAVHRPIAPALQARTGGSRRRRLIWPNLANVAPSSTPARQRLVHWKCS